MSHTIDRRIFTGAALCAALLLSGTWAAAEEKSTNDKEAETANVGTFMEEIVVTAQKREQPMQDVGIAVTAVSGDQMRTLGYTNAQEITALAPGVSTVQPNGEANYAIGIRGVANNDFTTNVESPIAVYVDEVYVSQMSGTGFMLFDMDRAEILRGPQGTLFGRNATGGLVQYVSAKPTDEFGGYGTVTLGSYDQVRFQGAVNLPVGEGFAARVSVASHQREGYVDNRLAPDRKLNDANDFAARTQLRWQRDEWDVLLNFRGARQDIRTGFFQHVSAVEPGRLTPNLANPFLLDAGGNPGYHDVDGDSHAGDYDFEGRNELTTGGRSLTVKWSEAGLSFTSITDASTTKRDYIEDSDASPTDYFNFFLTTDAEQFSQELRLAGASDTTAWVGGVYYMDLEVDDSNGGIAHGFLCDYFVLLGEAPCPPRAATDGRFGIYNPYRTETQSWSLFGQWERQVSDELTLILGGRWIGEEKEHRYRDILVLYDARATSGVDHRTLELADLESYTGSRDDGEWAARVQLDWRPKDDTLYYASYNRGVKSGGFNAPLLPTAGFVNETSMNYAPERLDAFEAGFKLGLAGGRTTLNGAVYRYAYADYQAFSIIGLDTFTLNADAESQGFELELRMSPSARVEALLGVGYIDTKVTDVPGITVNRAGLEALGEATKPGQHVRPVQTPEWNTNGVLRFEWPMSALAGDLSVQVAFEQRTEHFFNLTNTSTLTEDGYTLWNAMASYFPHATDNWSLRLAVQNLTDEEYVVQGFDLSGSITIPNGFWGMTEHYYGRPRMWSVSADFVF